MTNQGVLYFSGTSSAKFMVSAIIYRNLERLLDPKLVFFPDYFEKYCRLMGNHFCTNILGEADYFMTRVGWF